MSEFSVLTAMGSSFHSLGARGERSLSVREDSDNFPVLADLSEREGMSGSCFYFLFYQYNNSVKIMSSGARNCTCFAE